MAALWAYILMFLLVDLFHFGTLFYCECKTFRTQLLEQQEKERDHIQISNLRRSTWAWLKCPIGLFGRFLIKTFIRTKWLQFKNCSTKISHGYLNPRCHSIGFSITYVLFLCGITSREYSAGHACDSMLNREKSDNKLR